MKRLLAVLVLVLLAMAPLEQAAAEEWPSLDAFVAEAELVVLAEVVTVEDGRITLRAAEVWRGDIDALEGRDADGRWTATEGQHGLVVEVGQRVVMWYTAHNQPNPGTYARHNTAFPVGEDDTIVYAATGDPGEPVTLTLDALRAKLPTE